MVPPLSSIILASPKSAILACGGSESVRSTFCERVRSLSTSSLRDRSPARKDTSRTSGLRSRCVTPWRWQ